MVPRFSLVARSLSQLSMTMKAPAMTKPVKTLQHDPHTASNEDAGQQRDDGADRGEGAERAHMADTAHQPRRQEAAGDEAGRPGRAEQAERRCEKPSAWPRNGSSRLCSPDPASRKAVPAQERRTMEAEARRSWRIREWLRTACVER